MSDILAKQLKTIVKQASAFLSCFVLFSFLPTLSSSGYQGNLAANLKSVKTLGSSLPFPSCPLLQFFLDDKHFTSCSLAGKAKEKPRAHDNKKARNQ